MSCTFTFQSTTTTVYLNFPRSITFNDARELKTFHFWEDADLIEDAGKEAENITIEGTQDVNAYSYMADIDSIIDNEEEVTISGLGDDDNLNTTWYIENFSYSVSQPSITNWSITLEKSYTV